VLDRGLVDEWIKTEDRPSFLMARRLIRHEGLLVGGSSGSAVWAALEVAKRMGPGKRIVTLLPDSVRNYMTKFLDDRWMRENGFVEGAWEAQSVGDLVRALPPKRLVTGQGGDSVASVVARMKERGISQVPVMEGERLVGIVTETDVLTRLVEGRATPTTTLAEVMVRDVTTIGQDQPAKRLTELFARDLAGLVVDAQGRLVSILTKMDLVEALSGPRRGGPGGR
jgi:cystathionine beta-synthase